MDNDGDEDSRLNKWTGKTDVKKQNMTEFYWTLQNLFYNGFWFGILSDFVCMSKLIF